jgi:predicted phosphate transport protein (TIGR00153 family)
MSFSLLPKEEKFFELFELQAAHNAQAARIFKELVSAWDLQSPAFDKLRDLEHEADIATHEVIDKLNRTFVTPFDREDIHLLASELDSIIDLVQSASSRMQLYRCGSPGEDMANLADTLCQAAENVRKAIGCLKDMGESRRRILDYCIEINRLENTGDHQRDMALSKLFQGRPDPIDVIKWKEIFENVETAIDKCEDVANVLEAILVKQG